MFLRILGLLLVFSMINTGYAFNRKDVNFLSDFRSSNKIAIVVGVSGYESNNSGFTKLYYTLNDANLLSNTLINQGYRVLRITGAHATSEKIAETIQSLGTFIKPNQDTTVIFAFTGHGYSLNKKNYLATYNTNVSALGETGVSIDSIVEAIRKSGVTRLMLFIDACRNDPTIAKGLINGFYQQNLGEGIQILYSTKLNDVSFEDPNIQQGVFSYFLIKGLKGEAALQGVVDFSSLSEYVGINVSRWTSEGVKFSSIQRPFNASFGDYYGDFILAVYPRLFNTPNDSSMNSLVVNDDNSNVILDSTLLAQEERQKRIEADFNKAKIIQDQKRMEQLKKDQKAQNDRRLELHEAAKKQRIIDENNKRRVRTENIKRKRISKIRENKVKAKALEQKQRQRFGG